MGADIAIDVPWAGVAEDGEKTPKSRSPNGCDVALLSDRIETFILSDLYLRMIRTRSLLAANEARKLLATAKL